MIKFYQGTYSELSGKGLLTSANNICFVTDRKVLIMGGDEYGKDGGAIKIEATSGATAATGSRDVVSGTLFAFKGDQSLYRYLGGSSWEPIITPTLSSAGTDLIADAVGGTGATIDFASRATDSYQATAGDVKVATTALETKVKDAYTEAAAITPVSGTNTVVVSKTAGIAKTSFTLNQDRSLISVKTDGNGARSVAGTSTDTILVTETTLSEQTNDILANGLEIKKLTSSDTALGYNEGYRSQYALINKQTGARLGATIDLVKDQFLRGAEYVAAYEVKDANDNITGYVDWPANAQGRPTGIPENTTRDSLNRFLKLTFALPATGTNGAGGTSGSISPDSGENTYTGETDTTIYINVNELFDSYKSGAGVTVDQASNTLSAQIDASLNESGTHYTSNFLTVDAAGLKIQGIKTEISGEIGDIGFVDKTAGNGYNDNNNYAKFITSVGIDKSNNTISASASGLTATGVEYQGQSGTGVLLTDTTKALTIADESVETAIDQIATHIGALDYNFNGNQGAAVTQFIYAIDQTDGLIATSAKIVDAADLKATAYWATSGAITTEIVTGVSGVQASKNIGQIYTVSNAAASGNLQAALQTIVDSTANYLKALDLAGQGVSGNVDKTNTAVYTDGSGLTEPVSNTAVQFIEQEDGLVNVKMINLDAQNIRFDGITSSATQAPVYGYNVGAALSSISNYIQTYKDGLDYAGHAEGSAPTDGGTTKWTITKEVFQNDGLVSEDTLDLTAANTYQSGVTAKLTATADATTGANDASIGITQGSVQYAISQLAHAIADFGSFHDANGNVL